jgi:nicotinate (nicotinamide) nucleotide adenylyltransferase
VIRKRSLLKRTLPRRKTPTAKRIGVLPGAFNPLTRAHLALVEAALDVVDEVICVVPRNYPHKTFHGASLGDRVEMLRAASDRYLVHVSEAGLFVDIAHELRRDHPEGDLHFICGRDAAERVVSWDYGEPNAIERMLAEFKLLVAARGGTYEPPSRLRSRIDPLPIHEDFEDVSSTQIRDCIRSGEPWEHLVPESIVDLVRRIYATS